MSETAAHPLHIIPYSGYFMIQHSIISFDAKHSEKDENVTEPGISDLTMNHHIALLCFGGVLQSRMDKSTQTALATVDTEV